MSTPSIELKTTAAIWRGIIQPDKPGMAPEVAKYFLALHFSKKTHNHIHRLAIKDQQGKLKPNELTELNNYRNVAIRLELFQAKARLSLRKAARAR